MFISSHRIDDAPLAKRMKLDGELSMLSVFTSTISCSVPAEKNDAIFVHIIYVEIDFSAPPVLDYGVDLCAESLVPIPPLNVQPKALLQCSIL